jgi:hypothetical protein
MKYEDIFVAVDCNEVPWIQAQSPQGPKEIHYRRIIPGGEGMPQVQESRYAPHWTEVRHRHPEDEVLVIVEGEIEVEGKLYQAPSVVFVGRHTLYGPLTAGAEGVRFYRIAYNERLISRGEEAAQAAT